MAIRFKKLFHKAKDGEVLDLAIVSYHKNPWLMKDGIIVSYQNYLYIDLWLVALYFKWETDVHYKVNPPKK